jgi:Myb DNA-binding like
MNYSEENAMRKPLAHFLDNRNFQNTKRRPRRAGDGPAEEGGVLKIVDGKVVVNEGAGDYKEDRVTATSYSTKRTKRARWSKEETCLFHRALRVCGTDFTLMEKIFFDRDRRQIKNKFNKEEKENCAAISDALQTKIKFTKEDLDRLKKDYNDVKLCKYGSR